MAGHAILAPTVHVVPLVFGPEVRLTLARVGPPHVRLPGWFT
jgi:hypothetical protein